MRSDPADSAHVLPLGRTYFSEGLRWCAHCATGISFQIHAAQCSITLIGDPDAPRADQEPYRARIAIYVNEHCVQDLWIRETKQVVPVFAFDAPQTATVRIVKRSEASVSIFAIGDILSDADAAIRPSEASDRRIEFIGDSITCGYGVDDPGCSTQFLTRYENAEHAFACLTAKALCADCSLVAGSGYGVLSGFTEDDTIHAQGTLPPFYERFGFPRSYPTLFSPADIPWTFHTWQPDVIVINLGTNDDSYCKGDPARERLFQARYRSFLQTVRRCNPSASIFCMLGVMKHQIYPALERAVSEYREESGDQRIFCRQFPLQKKKNGYGSNWHPSAKTHQETAKLLTAWIRTQMDWNEPTKKGSG